MICAMMYQIKSCKQHGAAWLRSTFASPVHCCLLSIYPHPSPSYVRGGNEGLEQKKQELKRKQFPVRSNNSCLV